VSSDKSDDHGLTGKVFLTTGPWTKKLRSP